jgi:hypothetical protein
MSFDVSCGPYERTFGYHRLQSREQNKVRVCGFKWPCVEGFVILLAHGRIHNKNILARTVIVMWASISTSMCYKLPSGMGKERFAELESRWSKGMCLSTRLSATILLYILGGGCVANTTGSIGADLA